MSSFDSTGLTIDRFEDIVAALIADLQSSFGDDIRTDADSNFGQFINIIGGVIDELNETIENVAASQNPQNATGVPLSNLVLLNGIERKEAEFSTVSVTLRANDAGFTAPAGTLVAHTTTGDQFAVDAETVVPPGASVVTSATAVDPGPVTASTATLTVIVNPIYGWASVTNLSDASVGANEETDAELRARRAEAATISGASTLAAIFTALNNIDAVEAAKVYDNTSGSTDTDGVPGHSIWAVVLGGTDAEIAEVLFDTVAAGIGYFGTTTVSHADPISGASYDIDFSRPTEKPVYIEVNLTKGTDYPADGDTQIKEALVSYGTANLSIDDDVVNSRLYTPINTIEGHTINYVYQGFSASPSSAADLTVDRDQIAGIDTANITITT